MTEHRNRGRRLPGGAARYAGLLVVPILGLGLVACGGSGERASDASAAAAEFERDIVTGDAAAACAALAPESRN
ncbi:hypothetical protein [Streptomyces sp. NBC_00893]|uniref:hypothetical protein n=1 Tax=Streptomyces sp. NBC_00893 TaxID=2975862 RepID=UPI0022543145|nr:hypothetical protein [Streptomyces sp. NBC_00893]MCX4850060.1 hypothetical protein [Streptomyces sp. NBC_00893]